MAALAVVAIASLDAPLAPRSRAVATTRPIAPRSACEGARDAVARRSSSTSCAAGAFPGSGHPDVAVHVPPGFDATRRPGVVVYFHGWQGCVAAALSRRRHRLHRRRCRSGRGPTSRRRSTRRASTRCSSPSSSGPTCRRASRERSRMPGGLRDLLRELFSEHLAAAARMRARRRRARSRGARRALGGLSGGRGRARAGRRRADHRGRPARRALRRRRRLPALDPVPGSAVRSARQRPAPLRRPLHLLRRNGRGVPGSGAARERLARTRRPRRCSVPTTTSRRPVEHERSGARRRLSSGFRGRTATFRAPTSASSCKRRASRTCGYASHSLRPK